MSASDDVQRKRKLEETFDFTSGKKLKNEEQIPDVDFVDVPVEGTLVDRRSFRRVGPYILGPKVGISPVESIIEYLAKREGTNEFVQLKILMLSDDGEDSKNDKILQEERQGKMLLHTEFSLLALLENEEGVIHHHGMFSDKAYEEDNYSDQHCTYYTGKIRKRLVLVLDCVTSHEFNKKSTAHINLQQYLQHQKRLPEVEALKIFYEIILVVERLHKNNIIHRDLKLGNIVLNRISNKITITNFCLGKYLLYGNELLYDQRGSPAYISPDVLFGTPYLGKPSDMWALGVALFMLFYGTFPFYESTTSALFKKIKAAEYGFPTMPDISFQSKELIKGMLELMPGIRSTATQVREKIEFIIATKFTQLNLDQFVPVLAEEKKKASKTNVEKILLNSFQIFDMDQRVPVFNKPRTQIQVKRTYLPNSVHQPHIKQRKLTNKNELSTGSSCSTTNISVQKVSRDARPLTPSEMGQFQFLIRNDGSNNNINISSNSNNWQATIRFHSNGNGSTSTSSGNSSGGSGSNVTQQMRNLSIRNRRPYQMDMTSNGLLNQLSRPVIPPAVTTSSSPLNDRARLESRLYRFFRNSGNVSLGTPPSSQQHGRSNSSYDRNSSPESRLYRFFRANSAAAAAAASAYGQYDSPLQLIRRTSNASSMVIPPFIHSQTMPSTSANSRNQMVPPSDHLPLPSTSSSSASASTANASTSPLLYNGGNRASSLINENVKTLIDAIKDSITHNRTNDHSRLIDFTGTICPDIADKMTQWLIAEHGQHPIVTHIFHNSTSNAMNKIRTFLNRCGFYMQIINGTCLLKRYQRYELIGLIRILLKICGFNSSYFITS